MKKTIALILVVVISSAVYAQQLVVDGKAKITVMDQEDAEGSLVVVLPDGTLAQRDVSTVGGNINVGTNCRNFVDPAGGIPIGNAGSSKNLFMFSQSPTLPFTVVLLVEKSGPAATAGTLDVREIALAGPPNGFVFDTVRTNGLIGSWDFSTDGLLNGSTMAALTLNVDPTVSPAAWEISISGVSNLSLFETCIVAGPIGPTG